MEYPEYLKLSDMRAPVAEPDAVYVAPVKRKVEKQKPQAEIREIPANKRPLEWQIQTAGENYDAVHNKVKDAWDKYLISPEDVKDANDYYETELVYEDFPGAIPLAALGSTLSGEAYNAWRDLQTDPANLIGGQLLTKGKKLPKTLGAMYKKNGTDWIKIASENIPKVDASILYHGSPKTDIDRFDALARLSEGSHNYNAGMVFGPGDYVGTMPEKAMQYWDGGAIYGFEESPETLSRILRSKVRPSRGLTDFEKALNEKYLAETNTPLYTLKKDYTGQELYNLKRVHDDDLETANWFKNNNVRGIGPFDESGMAEYVLTQPSTPAWKYVNEGENNDQVWKDLSQLNGGDFNWYLNNARHLLE